MNPFMCNICGREMRHLIKDLFICEDCELISSNIPADNTLYDKSYQRKYERYSLTETGRAILNFRTAIVKVYSAGRLLDFGCGNGDFHRQFEDGKGFDINPFSDFCDVGTLLGKYDRITFWDSLEHLNDPKAVITGLGARFIFVSTPCYDDFVNDDAREIVNWHHYYPGEHIHYFNAKSLVGLFYACGYEPICKTFEESKYRTSGNNRNIITLGGKKWGI